jgi:phospholipid/cholesterol/gamma-HCH transport system substrate-binding protein
VSRRRLELLIRRNFAVMAAIVFFIVIAGGVAGYILDQVRFRWPWDDVTEISAEFPHSQAVTPGQGQEVTIAGVKVGDVGPVRLEDGRAVVRLDLNPKELNGPVYRNATLLLRPKTLIQDQSIALDPGTPDPSLPNRGRLEHGDRLGPDATQVNLNTDELLSALDTDTRDYLRLLLDAGGQGLKERGLDLRMLLKLSEPTLAQTARVTKSLAERRAKIRRLVSSLRRLSEATAEKDEELTSLVDASAATFGAIGEREAELTQAVERLPGTLRATGAALRDGRVLAREAGPALEELRPAARRLGPALTAAQPLLRRGLPIVRDELRPLVREAIPLFKRLRPSLRDLNRTTPTLVRTGKVLNYLVNELGYNPPGDEEGFIFHLAWTAHNLASVNSIEDSHGAAVRGLAQFSCSTVASFASLPIVNLVAASGACPP